LNSRRASPERAANIASGAIGRTGAAHRQRRHADRTPQLHGALPGDEAAERFEVHTGSPWRPRAGSLVNHRTLTAAMIDSRDFLAAGRRADTEVMLPEGPKIAFTGGLRQRGGAVQLIL
jgi:hypothetical protein